MVDEPGQSPLTTLRRSNSISTPVQVSSKLTLLTPKPLQTATSFPNGNAVSPPLDLELISLKTSLASYTSLKDILPSSAVAICSPTAAGSVTNSGYEISIRNRLVKQAAWAYLQVSLPRFLRTPLFRSALASVLFSKPNLFLPSVLPPQTPSGSDPSR
ncbi:hypothetical protein REPUB_Repub06bG0150700 [Reevesia pubescens]